MVQGETDYRSQDVVPRSYVPLRSSRSRARSGHTLTVEAPRARWTCTRRAPVTNDGRGSDEQRTVAQIEGPEATWGRRTTGTAQQVTAGSDEHRGCGRVQRGRCSHRIQAKSRRHRHRGAGRHRAEVVRWAGAVIGVGRTLGERKLVTLRTRLVLVARRLHRLIAVRARTRSPQTERQERNQRDDHRTLQSDAIIREGCSLVNLESARAPHVRQARGAYRRNRLDAHLSGGACCRAACPI